MLKKSLYVGAGVALLLALLFGRDAISYVSTAVDDVRQAVKDNIPVETELRRAEDMVQNIDPEIRKSMHLIAKEEVEIERLEKQIARMEDNLGGEKENILKLQADVQSGENYFYYASHRYSRDEVSADLKKRFERFKTSDATLAKLQGVLNARQKSVDAAREKLDDMVAAKKQLEVEVANLRARQKMVEVAKTTSDFRFDDSHLSRTKNLLAEIEARIKTEEKVVDASGNFEFEIPVNEPEATNVSEEVAEYFANPRASQEVFVNTDK